MELRIADNRICAHCGKPIGESEAWHWATTQPRPEVWGVQSVHSRPADCSPDTDDSLSPLSPTC